MPADQGLSSLGLLMQLAGSLFAGYAALLGILPIFAGAAGGGLIMFAIGALGVVRALLHRSAGSALVYGSASGILRSLRVYIVVAAVQTVMTLLLLNASAPLPTVVNLSIGLALLVWPAVLTIVVSRPSMRELVAHDSMPVAEDFGFEGAAALMVLLGMLGALSTGFFLYLSVRMFGTALGGQGFLIIGVLAMLLARSVLQVMAGMRGTRGIDSDGATESAARYFSFGVVSSVVTGAALLILFFTSPGLGLHPLLLLVGSIAVGLLLAWPTILRRFYSERNFSALLSGAEGPSHRRAPDAGMTAVGWLLIALGALELAYSLPQALAGDHGLGQTLAAMDPLRLGLSGLGAAERSPWWTIGVLSIQLWAGYELVRMSDRHRLAATVYGAVATLVTLFLAWPRVHELERLDVGGGMLGGLGSTAGTLGIAISLVLPVGTAILANRRLMPTAQARIRTSARD